MADDSTVQNESYLNHFEKIWWGNRGIHDQSFHNLNNHDVQQDNLDILMFPQGDMDMLYNLSHVFFIPI